MVVDTSVWIDFFAGRPCRSLEQALRQGTVILSPIVAAELVSGATQAAEQEQLLALLADLPVHSTPLAHWIEVGHLRRRLGVKGIAVSTPDAHIAQCALDLDVPLLSRDAVFQRIAAQTDLRLVTGG